MRRLLVLLLVTASFSFVGRGGIPCDAVEAQPSCLVALLPGPTANTLDILEVSGDVSVSNGQLLLTTVSVQSALGFRDWIRGSFDDRISHIDRDIIYPPGVTVEAVREQNVFAMEQSQLDAILAAFVAMGHDVFRGAEVVDVQEESAASDGRLRPGDVIVTAAGATIRARGDLAAALARFGVGDEVSLVIQRNGVAQTVTFPLIASPEGDRAILGIQVQDSYELPVDVNIDAGEIGGPSAGLMFAIAIVDALTPADLTGGLIIAGTGEIRASGEVGAIGGIQQKILGATSRFNESGQRTDEDGVAYPPATIFLVPELNMPEARKTPVRSEVTLIPVATLQDALDALVLVRDGQRPANAVVLAP